MGQEQSSSKSPSRQATLSLTSSISDTTAQSFERDDKRLEMNEQPEEGIINVSTAANTPLEEEELVLLKAIQKFEPFIKEQEKSLGIDQILGLKSKAASVSQEEVQQSDHVLDIFFGLQNYVKEHMYHINLNQRSLLKRIAYVDELSGIAAQTMVSALNQAKLKSGKIAEVQAMKEQITQIRNDTIHIFKALSALEEHLDPDDRIPLDIKTTRWPELHQLRIDTSKPLIERYISSSSDLAIVGTTSGPFIIDQEDDDGDQRKTASTTPPVSLALDRLRGLSSQSLAMEEDK